MGKLKVKATVNGNERELEGYPFTRLLDALRGSSDLTGTKEGCGEGECGACAVMMNGRMVNSCLVPLAQASSSEIRTVEGIAADDGALHPVQDAFLEFGGAQCGICTPGMLIAAVDVVERNLDAGVDDLDDETIRESLAGNLCRCTGYMKIFDSVREAYRAMRSARRAQRRDPVEAEVSP